jgi:hypothetical protein
MAITPLPTPPSRSQSPATFSTDADAFLGALPAFATEANALATDVNADEISAAAAATAAANSANIAVGAANYKGDYNAGTTYQIGQSVTSGGRQWVAKTINTGITPVAGANWLLINDGDVLGPLSATDNALAVYDGTTGKIIKAVASVGTSGQVLVSNGAGSPPSFAPLPGANLPRSTRTSNIQLVAADNGRLIEYTANSFTQTFASAAALGAGWWCYLSNGNPPAFERAGGVRAIRSTSGIASGNLKAGFIQPDGTNLFTVNPAGSGAGMVYRYGMSTPNDLLSLNTTFNQSFNASAQVAGNVHTILFRPNGLQMFIFAYSGSNAQVFVYNLSTAWSISTATYSGTSFTFDLAGFPNGAAFKDDGTAVYIGNSSQIRQYTLGTAWAFTSVTTAHTLSINEPVSDGLMLSSDGRRMFTYQASPGFGYSRLAEYRLSTAWQISSATFYNAVNVCYGNINNFEPFYAVGTGRMFFRTSSSFSDYVLNSTQSTFDAMENQSGRDITLEAFAGQTIDGRTSFVMYPGELRLVVSDGSNLFSYPIKPFQRVFTVTGTFVSPPGYSAYNAIVWGAGAGGFSGADIDSYGSGHFPGGGGGAYAQTTVLASSIQSFSVPVFVGAGGAGGIYSAGSPQPGGAGGRTSFGSFVTAYGGLSVYINNLSGGASMTPLAINVNASRNPTFPADSLAFYNGGTQTSTSDNSGYSIFGGGAGGASGGSTSNFGSCSMYGGGGGASSTTTGGRSFYNQSLIVDSSAGSTPFLKGGGSGGRISTTRAATPLPAFGQGGGGSFQSSSSFPAGVGAVGGIAGGGGSGANASVSNGFTPAVGGAGGNGLCIVQGVI